MRIGVSLGSFNVVRNPISKIIDRAIAVGFEAVEIGPRYIQYRDGEFFWPKRFIEKQELVKRINSVNLQVFLHARGLARYDGFHDLNRTMKLPSDVQITEGNALKECFQRCLDAASPLGAEVITIHHEDVDDASLRWMYRKAIKEGVTLCLENDVTTDLEELKERIDETKLEHLQITFDVGHAFMNLGKNSLLLRSIKKLSSRLMHVHVHDSDGCRDHLPIGKGTVDFPSIIDVLKCIGYDGCLSLELNENSPERWIREGKEILGRLISTPKDILHLN